MLTCGATPFLLPRTLFLLTTYVLGDLSFIFLKSKVTALIIIDFPRRNCLHLIFPGMLMKWASSVLVSVAR